MKMMRKYYPDDTPGKRYYVYANPWDACAVLLEINMLKVYQLSDQADSEIIKVIYQSRGSFFKYEEGNTIVMSFYHLPETPQDAKKELVRLSLDDVGQ